MSASLGRKIQLRLDEPGLTRAMLAPLIARTGEQELPVMETAAACSMLHSFYTEIEQIFKVIALDFDQHLPESDAWRRDLLSQMSIATAARPAVVSRDLVPRLSELLAFRHLFRGASIALMRWNKLAPLVVTVSDVHDQVVREITDFQRFLTTVTTR